MWVQFSGFYIVKKIKLNFQCNRWYSLLTKHYAFLREQSCQNVLECLPYHIVLGRESVRFAVFWFLLGFQGTPEMLSRWPIGRIACGCLSGGELLSKTPTSRSNGKVSHKHPLRGPFSLDTCAKTSSRIYFLNLISKKKIHAAWLHFDLLFYPIILLKKYL